MVDGIGRIIGFLPCSQRILLIYCNDKWSYYLLEIIYLTYNSDDNTR
jgi:hypothetical protein